MARLLFFGFLGFVLALFFSRNDEAPVAVQYWSSSALLSRYRQVDDKMKAHRIVGGDSPLAKTQKENFEAAERRVAAAVAKRPLSLFGELHPDLHRANFFHGRVAIRISCAKGQRCCSQFLRWNETESRWSVPSARDALGGGYFDDKGHFVMSIDSGFRPPEEGLAFLFPFAEVPMEGQTRTNLLAMDPDSGRWENRGSVEWAKQAALVSCL